MQVKVKLSNLRTSPRKTRRLVDMIRGKKASEAQAVLAFTVNKSSAPVLKLLNSALATAKNDLHLDAGNLFVSKITVDEGPKLKRWHAMSRGRAYPIIKRTCHVALELSEKPEVKTEVKPTIKKRTVKKVIKNKIK